ncbi:DUF2267 domain-containing protein [Allosaccharopolyspora coralli]|uniref:DUF2267 domain-containing protein n=1 Tax=Allosaccharopolyspora coralli TaxID=2665642 RepID=A0A5Q3QIN0_9PSEU|nr:DUF2267 domain-containing protein [Allosaccharopolyspora coralli]QGK70707.1 DUF2267 domain-containing protein [Allosaccharopolyspora coralli]
MTESLWPGATMRSFVEQAQEAAGVSSFEEADALVRATLTTLGESVSGGQIDELVQGLPPEVRDELSRRSGQARAMDKNGFLDRVSGAISTTDLERTEQQVRAVLATVRDWAPEGETADTIDQLPPSLAQLFR